MDELIKAMSNKDLTELKGKYSNNPSVVTLIDGILETRGKEAQQVKARQKFTDGIGKLFATLPHPDDIANVYASWQEVDVESGEAEEVEVVDVLAVTDKDGKITTPAVMKTESRIPTVKVHQWVVEVNKGFRVASGGGSTPTTSKRAITVFKREGLALNEKGHFASASKACEALGLTIGGDSATRVLAREGYITEAFEGDLTS